MSVVLLFFEKKERWPVIKNSGLISKKGNNKMRTTQNNHAEPYKKTLDNLHTIPTRYHQSTFTDCARQAWLRQTELMDIAISFLSTSLEVIVLNFNKAKIDLLLEARDSDGNSLLHWAVIANRDDVFHKLLDTGFNLLSIGIFELNSLQLAIMLNSKKVAFYISNHYGNVGSFKIILDHREMVLNTLQFAILFGNKSGNKEIVNKIISRDENNGIPINWNVDIVGNLLHLAIMSNQPDILAYLLSKIDSLESKEILLQRKWLGLSVLEHARKDSNDCLAVLEKDAAKIEVIIPPLKEPYAVTLRSRLDALLGYYLGNETKGLFCCATQEIKKFEITANKENIKFIFEDNTNQNEISVNIPKEWIESALLSSKKSSNEKIEISVGVTRETQYSSQSPMVYLHVMLADRDKITQRVHLVFDKNHQLNKIKIDEQYNDQPCKTLFFAKNIRSVRSLMNEARTQLYGNTDRQPNREPYSYAK